VRTSRSRLLALVTIVIGGLSAAPVAQADIVPTPLAPPSISGSAEQGQTVTCSPGAWLNSPTSYSYSWQRDATTPVGSASDMYTLTAADVSHVITCTVVAHNAAGDSVPAISAPIVPLGSSSGSIPIDTAPPTISGSPIQGQTVSCLPGSWSDDPTSFLYSWQRAGTAISGATGPSYVLSATDVGQAITCTVAALNAFGLGAPSISAPIVPAALGVPGGGPGSGPGFGPGSGGARLHGPRITAFWLTPSKITIVVKGSRRRTSGTVLHYVLDQKAGVLIEVQRRLLGRVHGGRCVVPTRRNATAAGCTRWVTARVRVLGNAHAGSNRYRYLGRIGSRNQVLPAGIYRVRIVAKNAAGWSGLRSRQFRAVVRTVKASPPPGAPLTARRAGRLQARGR
jgi:hypothetical protein